MSTSPPIATDLSSSTGSWVLDPAKTEIVFHTKAMWLFNVRGTATALEGSATVSPEGAIAGTLVVDAASINTGNSKRDQHLRTADFFEVDKYPTITFVATGGRTSTAGRVELTGTLSFHGQTRPLTLSGEVASSGEVATVAAEAEVDRSDWGLSWAKMGAGMKNQIVVKAAFKRE